MRIMKGETNLTLSAQQLQEFLDKNHRNAESLLGAYRASRDTNLLKEATEKFPNDPRVAFEAAFFRPPEERRKWLDMMKQSAQENALPNYLSAASYFKSGQPDQAMQDLVAAANKPKYSDYSLDFLESSEEAYRAAGYSDAETDLVACTQLLLPHLAELRSVGRSLAENATTYQQSGDSASAQEALQMAVALGKQLDQPDSFTLIQKLVAISIQELAFKAMDQNDPTVQTELAAIAQKRQAIRDLNQQFQALMSGPGDPGNSVEQGLVTFFQREKLFGAQSAMQWAVSKYGQ
jgi:hypothetical protein